MKTYTETVPLCKFYRALKTVILTVDMETWHDPFTSLRFQTAEKQNRAVIDRTNTKSVKFGGIKAAKWSWPSLRNRRLKNPSENSAIDRVHYYYYYSVNLHRLIDFIKSIFINFVTSRWPFLTKEPLVVRPLVVLLGSFSNIKGVYTNWFTRNYFYSCRLTSRYP